MALKYAELPNHDILIAITMDTGRMKGQGGGGNALIKGTSFLYTFV